MKTRSRKRRVALVVLAAVGILVLLNVTGFCISQMRYVSDSEFIDRALVYRAGSIKELSKDKSREAVQDYRKNNPRCCRVEGSQSGFNSSFINDILGFRSTWVRIIHRLTDEAAAVRPADGSFYEAYIEFDCCGRPIRVTGERVTESQANSL